MFFDHLPEPLKLQGIWNISGPPYCGKTLFMNWCAKEVTTLCGKDAYSTFESKYTKVLNNLGDLDHIEYIEDAHTWVGLDDLVPWLDCRYGGRNVASTWMFNKYRKKGLFIMYSEQVLGSLDFRLENITDVFIRSRPLKFPQFLIVGFYQDGSLAFNPFSVEYGPDVYETYKTLEIVQLKIKLEDLDDLYEKAGSSSIFKVFIHARFGLTKEVGENLFALLKKSNIELLTEYIKNLGYQLITE